VKSKPLGAILILSKHMVNSIVRKSLNAIASKQTNIFSAAFFIILTTIFSQLLGVFKYRLLVSYFGASSDLGVFLASFRIPDFLFQVLIAGALFSSFIPIFSEYLSKGKKEEAFSMTSSLITIGIIIYSLISIVVILFSYQLASIITPGFSKEELSLMANLIRIIQLSQLFFILGTVATVVLQSYQHFLIPGIATSLYNLGIILGLILFASTFGIYGATIGVLIGSLLFFLVQTPLLKKTGFVFRPTLNLQNGVTKIFDLMIPRSITIIIVQLSITANVFFASFLSARSLVVFDLAQTLVMAPVLLFGQSIAQASFPSLALKKENKQEFLSIFLSSFNQILYLTLPVSVLLIVLRIPLVRLFYGTQRFDWQATIDTGLTLALFSISVFAQALIYLLSRAFYAFKDTKTPLYITLISVIFNVTLSYLFILIYKLPIYYLALSYSFATILSFILMTFFVNKKVSLPKVKILLNVIKISVASLIMGFSLYVPIKLLDQLVFDTTRTINLIMLTGIASFLGFSTYIFFTWLLNIKEAYYIIAAIKRFGNWQKVLKQVEEPIDGPKFNP